MEVAYAWRPCRKFHWNETLSTGHGVYGEHGAESIHKVFNLLQRTYCSIKPATRHLQSMLKEHYRLIHPDAKALKPVIIKKKWNPEGENSVLS